MVRILCGVAAAAMLLGGMPAAAQINGSTQKPTTGPILGSMPKPASPKKPRVASGARSAASMECSRQADEKKLTGKDRKKFRTACLKDAKKK